MGWGALGLDELVDDVGLIKIWDLCDFVWVNLICPSSFSNISFANLSNSHILIFAREILCSIVKLEKMARQGNARFFRSPLSRHDRSNLLTSFWIFSSSCYFCFLLFLLRAWVRLQE